MTETIERPAAALATTEPTQGSLKATALASFVPIEAHLTTLAARYDKVAFTDLATPKGLAAAKAIRLELREQGRFAVQRLQKRLKDEANDLKRIVDDRSEELIAIIRPVEDNAHGQIEAAETLRAEAKAERERLEFEERARLAAVEAERVAKLHTGIAKIRGYVARCQEVGMTADRIAAGMAHLEAQALGDKWEDHLQQAQDAQAESLAAMRSLHSSALAREQAARDLEAQRAENERVAAEQAVQKRLLDAQVAEFSANMTRIAGHQQRIDEIKAAATGHEIASAADLAEAITAVAALNVSEAQYQEMAPPAAAAQAATLAVLWRLHDAARERAELARLAAEQAELSLRLDAEDAQRAAAALAAAADTGGRELEEALKVLPADAAEPTACDFALPDFDAALDPLTLAVESEAAEAAVAINVLEVEVDSLVEQLDRCRAALADACNLLDKLITAHSPKRAAARYFAWVVALRDSGGLPRPTTTTKENN